jgi:Ser/Thr protein kinase RdoA (MazF antagonist)
VSQVDFEPVAAGLGRPILDAVRQPGRTRAMVFKVRTPDGALAIKVYPDEYSESELRSEFQLAELLHGRGVAVPRYLAVGESDVFGRLADGSGVLVYEWMAGHAPARLDRDLIENGAALLASFHQAVRGAGISRDDAWLWSDAARHASARRKLPDDLGGWIEERACGGRPWGEAETLIACHNDFVPGNLVVSDNGKVVAIDLTNAILAPPEWDVAVYCAGLLLASVPVELDPPATFACAVDSYARSGVGVRGDYVRNLLEVALAQRSVFLTERVSAQREAQVWERLAKVVREPGMLGAGSGSLA